MILSINGIIAGRGVIPSTLLTNLYAAYKAESNANDSFGLNNGTSQGGLTYSTGKSGNAFTFNGTNAHVLMPVNSMKKTTFSMNFWIFNPSAQSTTIFTDFGNDGTNKGFYLDLSSISSHTIRFVAFNSSTNIIALNASGGIGFLNRWSMTTLVVNGASVKIYLDGSLIASGTMTNTINYVANSYPCIGAYKLNNNTPISYLINGTKLDEVGIWNKELTPTEVTELYNSGAGKFYPYTFTPSTLLANLVSVYKAENNTNDSLGTNNGTAQGGLTYSTGKNGDAFTFNGTNSLVSLPSNSITYSNNFSISFWVSVGANGTTQTILSTYTNISGAERGLLIRFGSNGVMSALGFNSSGSLAFNSNVSGGAIPTNTWRFFTVTVSTTQVKWYVNGSLDATFTLSSNISHRANTEPGIGAYYKYDGTNNLAFMSNNSKIDELNIWNRELTATEITELYNSGAGKFYPY